VGQCVTQPCPPATNPSDVDKEKLLRQPFVIPLVVTDNLEGALTSNTSEVVRQLALALSALIQNVQAKAEVQKLRDELRSITGADINSLLTVARLSDNIIRVRLGAVRSPIANNAYVITPPQSGRLDGGEQP
jgi:hypothetical protein